MLMNKDYKIKVRTKARNLKRDLLRRIVLPYARIAFWEKIQKPDFIGIGAPRSASTWLHKRLSLHPQIYLPRMKELHFFDERRYSHYSDDSGINWYRSFYFNPEIKSHLRWYALQFRAGQDLIKGEITPDYSTLSPGRVKYIANYLPDLKIIYIIRHPVDRAWSNLRRVYWHQLGVNSLSTLSANSLRLSVMHPEVLIRGEYQRTIKTWESCFNQDQILYLFFDDIKNSPHKQLERVCRFLDVEPNLLTDFENDRQKVNKAPESDMPANIRSDYMLITEKQ